MSVVETKTWYVGTGDTDFKTIKEAVAAAAVGDTIIVQGDEYTETTERVTISKSITLKAEGDVTMRGLNIGGTNFDFVVDGIKFVAAETDANGATGYANNASCIAQVGQLRNVTVQNCSFDLTGAGATRTYGLFLSLGTWGFENLTVQNNECIGVLADEDWSGYGLIYAANVNNADISGNTVSGANGHAIQLSTTGKAWLYKGEQKIKINGNTIDNVYGSAVYCADMNNPEIEFEVCNNVFSNLSKGQCGNGGGGIMIYPNGNPVGGINVSDNVIDGAQIGINLHYAVVSEGFDGKVEVSGNVISAREMNPENTGTVAGISRVAEENMSENTVTDKPLGDADVSTSSLYVNDAWTNTEAGKKVAVNGKLVVVGTNAFADLNAAVAAAGEVAEIVVSGNVSGKAVFANGKKITITGEAEVAWADGWFFVGRGADDAVATEVTIKDAVLNSPVYAWDKAGTGFNVAQDEGEGSGKADGILNIENSKVATAYLANRNIVNVKGDGIADGVYGYGKDGEANLVVRNGFYVSRDNDDTKAAEMNITDGAYVIVEWENAMGIGYNGGRGVLNVTDSKFETSCTHVGTNPACLTVHANGAVNVTNSVFTIANTLTNDGSVVVNDSIVTIGTFNQYGSQAVFNNVELNVENFVNGLDASDTYAVIGGTSLVKIENLTGNYALRFADGAVIKGGSSVKGLAGRVMGDVTVGEKAEDEVFFRQFDNSGSTGDTITVNGILNVGIAQGNSGLAGLGSLNMQGHQDGETVTLTGAGTINVDSAVYIQGHLDSNNYYDKKGVFVIDEDLTINITAAASQSHLRFTYSDTTIYGKVYNLGKGADLSGLRSATVTVSGSEAVLSMADDFKVGYSYIYDTAFNYADYKSVVTVEDGATLFAGSNTYINLESVVNVKNAEFTTVDTLKNNGTINVDSASTLKAADVVFGADGKIVINVTEELAVGESSKVIIDVAEGGITAEEIKNISTDKLGYTVEFENEDIVIKNSRTQVSDAAGMVDALADENTIAVYVDGKISVDETLAKQIIANWDRIFFASSAILLWPTDAFDENTPEAITASANIQLAPAKVLGGEALANAGAEIVLGGEAGYNGITENINGEEFDGASLSITNETQSEVRSKITMGDSGKDVIIDNKSELKLTGLVQTGGNVEITNNSGAAGDDEAVLNGGSDEYGAQINADGKISVTNEGHLVGDFSSKKAIFITNNSSDTVIGNYSAPDVVIIADEGKAGSIENSTLTADNNLIIRGQTLENNALTANTAYFYGEDTFAGENTVNVATNMRIGKASEVVVDDETYNFSGDAAVTVAAGAKVTLKSAATESGLHISGKENGDDSHSNGVLNVYGEFDLSENSAVVNGALNIGKAEGAEAAGSFTALKMTVDTADPEALVKNAKVTVSGGAVLDIAGEAEGESNYGMFIGEQGELEVNGGTVNATKIDNAGSITVSGASTVKASVKGNAIVAKDATLNDWALTGTASLAAQGDVEFTGSNSINYLWVAGETEDGVATATVAEDADLTVKAVDGPYGVGVVRVGGSAKPDFYFGDYTNNAGGKLEVKGNLATSALAVTDGGELEVSGTLSTLDGFSAEKDENSTAAAGKVTVTESGKVTSIFTTFAGQVDINGSWTVVGAKGEHSGAGILTVEKDGVVNLAGTLASNRGITVKEGAELNISGGKLRFADSHGSDWAYSAVLTNNGTVNISGESTVDATFAGKAVQVLDGAVITGSNIKFAEFDYANGNLIANGDITIKDSQMTTTQVRAGKDASVTIGGTVTALAVADIPVQLKAVENGEIIIDGTFTAETGETTGIELEGKDAKLTVNADAKANITGGFYLNGGTTTITGKLAEDADLAALTKEDAQVTGAYTTFGSTDNATYAANVTITDSYIWNAMLAVNAGSVVTLDNARLDGWMSMNFTNGTVTATNGSIISHLAGEGVNYVTIAKDGKIGLEDGSAFSAVNSEVKLDGAFTMDGDSTFTANTLTFGEGATFTIDATDFYGFKKVVDLSGTASLKDKVTVNMAEGAQGAIYNEEGDITLVNIKTDTLYVNEDYSGDDGDEVEEGKFFGYNAFASGKEAVEIAAVNAGVANIVATGVGVGVGYSDADGNVEKVTTANENGLVVDFRNTGKITVNENYDVINVDTQAIALAEASYICASVGEKVTVKADLLWGMKDITIDGAVETNAALIGPFNLVVNGSFNVADNLMMQKGAASVKVGDKGELVVEDLFSVATGNTVDIAGTADVKTLKNAGVVNVAGTLTSENTLVNDSVINVTGNNAKIDAEINGTGVFAVKDGADFTNTKNISANQVYVGYDYAESKDTDPSKFTVAEGTKLDVTGNEGVINVRENSSFVVDGDVVANYFRISGSADINGEVVLEGTSPSVIKAGAELVVDGNLINKHTVAEDGQTITSYPVDLENEGTLTVNGMISLAGKVENIDVDSVIKNSGLINVTNSDAVIDAEITGNGAVVVKDGADYATTNDITANRIYVGYDLATNEDTAASKLTVSENSTVSATGEGMYVRSGSSVVVDGTLNAALINLKGDLTVNGSVVVDGTWGGSVDEGAVITVNGSFSNAARYNESAGDYVVGENGSIVIAGGKFDWSAVGAEESVGSVKNAGSITVSGDSQINATFTGNAVQIAKNAVLTNSAISAELALNGAITVNASYISGTVTGNQVITVTGDTVLALDENSAVKSITIDGKAGFLSDETTIGSIAINGKTGSELTADADVFAGNKVSKVALYLTDVDYADVIALDIDSIANVKAINTFAVTGNATAGYRFKTDGGLVYSVTEADNGLNFAQIETDIAGNVTLDDYTGSLDGLTADTIIEGKAGTAKLKISNGKEVEIAAITKDADGGVNNITIGKEAVVTVSGNVEEIGKLSTSTGADLTINGAAEGTNLNSTISLGKDNVAVFNGGIDLEGGKNTFSIGARTDATVTGDVANVRTIKVASGTYKKATKTAAASTDLTTMTIYGDIVAPAMSNSITLGNYAKLSVYGGLNNSDVNVGTKIKVGKNSNINFSGAMLSVSGLTLGSGSTFDQKGGDIIGTSGNNTFSFGADSRVNVQNIDLAAGKNTVKVGNGADITAGTVANISKLTIGKTADVKIAAVEGVNASVSLSTGAELKVAGQMTGLSKLTIGKEAGVTATAVEGVNANISLAAGAELTVTGNVTGVNKLTVAKGAELDIDGILSGTDKNDTISFANNAEITEFAEIDSIDLGLGNDKLAIGNNVRFKTADLAFGDGNDTLTLGKNAIIKADDISGVETLKASKGAVIIASSINDVNGDIKLDDVAGTWKNATIYDLEGVLNAGTTVCDGQVYGNEWDVYEFTVADQSTDQLILSGFEPNGHVQLELRKRTADGFDPVVVTDWTKEISLENGEYSLCVSVDNADFKGEKETYKFNATLA